VIISDTGGEIMNKLLVLFTLLFCSSLTFAGSYELGKFLIETDDGFQVRVSHKNNPLKIVWETKKGQPFINLFETTRKVRYDRASFRFKYRTKRKCLKQTVDNVRNYPGRLTIIGNFSDCENLSYAFDFYLNDDNKLGFKAQLFGDEKINKIKLIYASHPDELFYGFGEQYFPFNAKGKRLPIWCEEQGHGRGIQPLTFLMRLTGARMSAGYWYTTYSYVPYYLTSFSRSLYLTNYHHLAFDLRKDDEVAIEIFDRFLEGAIINGETPLDIVSEFTKHTGRMSPLPDWTSSGAIVRADGGADDIRESVKKLKDAGIKVAAVWIEDWVGKRETLLGSRLWWNWEANSNVYPDWVGLLKELNDQDIRVITYFNPYLSRIEEKHRDGGFRTILFDEALEKGFLVKNKDGGPYMFGAGFFSAAIIDLSNPAAREWIKNKMIEQVNLGVSGWMADFAEAIPLNGVIYSGEDAESFHNKFPMEWAKLNREVMRSGKLNRNDTFFFNRSGSTKSPQHASLFWTGDQLVNWDDRDGIKSVIPALTSSGMSGWTLNHAEVGGYLSVNLLFKKYNRSRELFLRWNEISLFTPLFRTHATNRPNKNYQWDNDADSKRMFAHYAKLFVAFAPYRKKLFEEAHEKGYPYIRHPILHFHEDPSVFKLNQQFMVGSEFMVAPVMTKGKNEVSIYLPKGKWVHLWSYEIYTSSGSRFTVDAPIGKPAVFFRYGSVDGEALYKRMRDRGMLDIVPIRVN
jgi:alpha-glucosidase